MSKKHYDNRKLHNEKNDSVEETAAAVQETEAAAEEVKEVKAPEVKKDLVSDEMGNIAAATKIVGDILTAGHLAIAGQVVGDIEAKGDIFTVGQIEGKISCRNLKADSGSLKTEMKASESVIIGKDSNVTGCIYCRDITVSGTIHGDITASGRVVLTSSAVVKGNITAASFGVELGAKLVGSVSVA